MHSRRRGHIAVLRNRCVKGGKGMFRYSANVLDPIQLFDELIRLGQGNVPEFQAVRDGAWPGS